MSIYRKPKTDEEALWPTDEATDAHNDAVVSGLPQKTPDFPPYEISQMPPTVNARVERMSRRYQWKASVYGARTPEEAVDLVARTEAKLRKLYEHAHEGPPPKED